MNIAVFDLPSVYWPVAESVVRSGREPGDVAGAVVERLRALTERCYCTEAIFAVEHKPYWRSVLFPAYKAGRREKDPALVAQYERVVAALRESGASVAAAVCSEPDPSVVFSWYEADDVCASLAKRIVADMGACAVVVSDDHDLAQCLPDEGERVPTFAAPRVYLARATLKGSAERWVGGVDVGRKYGVPPSRLWEYLALAGDSDFHPYDGVGEVTAKSIAASWDRATLREVVFDTPSREWYLLGGAKHHGARVIRALSTIRERGVDYFELAGKLARLRDDADIDPEAMRFGWGDVAEALK